jgi:Protein of unknown function (DUF3592)
MDDNMDANANKSSPKRSGKGGFSSLGLFILLMAAVPVWFLFIGPMIRHDQLVKNGIKAEGRLLSVDETGNTFNDAPELELVIEFKRQDGRLDTATTDFVPSLRTLHYYQAGVKVTTAYDPEDPEDVTVVDLETSGPAASPAAQVGHVPADNTADSLRRVSDSLKRALEELQSKVDNAKGEQGGSK